MKKIFVLILLISMVLLISLIGLRDLEEDSSNQGKAVLVILTIGSTIREEIDFDRLNVLEILQKNHDIEIIQNGPNIFIKCIDDVCAKGGFWWKFSVNGKLVLSSVDKYYPKDKDILLLEYSGKG